MKIPQKRITDDQMASLHIAYREFARELTARGYDLKAALNQCPTIEVPITEHNFKEVFVRPVLEVLGIERKSHNSLTADQVEMVFDTLNRAMANRFGISIEFPEKKDDDDA